MIPIKKLSIAAFAAFLFSNPCYALDLLNNTGLYKAQDLISEKNYVKAIELLKQFISLNPNSAEGHYYLAIAYKESGKQNIAMQEFQLAYKISNPELIKEQKTDAQEQDYIDLGNSFFVAKKYEKAVKYYDYALKINPENEEALLNTARSYFEINNNKKAEEFAKLTLDKNPSNILGFELLKEISQNTKQINSQDLKIQKYTAEYFNARGIEFLKTNDLTKAEKYFKKAIDANKDFSTAYNNLANVEFKNNNYKKAIKSLKKAIKLDSQNADAYFNFAMIYAKLGNYKKELSYLQKTLELEPDHYKAFYYKALNHHRQGHFNKAKNDFITVLGFDKYKFEANYNLGIIFANQFKIDLALRHLEAAQKQNPKNEQLLYYLATIYECKNNTEKAVDYYKKASKITPKIDYFRKIANIYIAQDQPIKAMPFLKKAIDYNKNDIKTLNMIGLCLFKQGNYLKSSRYFKKLTLLDPLRSIYHYNLSQCYSALGYNDKSRDEFEKAIVLEPVKERDFIDLANIFADKKMYRYASTFSKKGLEKFPDSRALKLTQIRLFKEQGLKKQYYKALNHLKTEDKNLIKILNSSKI